MWWLRLEVVYREDRLERYVFKKEKINNIVSEEMIGILFYFLWFI